MHHFFDVEVAKLVGVNAAIIFSHLAFWCQKNEANEEHFYDGRYWTRNSRKAYGLLFPYMTDKQIRSAFDVLEDAGLIVSGVYNENKYDRTAWHALADKGLKMCGKGKSIGPTGPIEDTQKGQPIPYIYTDNNNTPYNPPTENAEKPKRKPKLSEAEAEAFIAESKLPDELIPKVEAWIQYKAERNEGYVKSGLTALITTIKKQATAHGSAAVAEVIVESMARGWKGICWERLPDKPKPEAPKRQANEAPKPTAAWVREYMEQQKRTREAFELRVREQHGGDKT